MVEDAQVDTVNDHVRPHTPVRARPHGIAISAPAGQSRGSVAVRNEMELRAFRNEVTLEMRRVNIVRAEFLHGRRAGYDGERKVAVLLPSLNPLDKRPGGKQTSPERAHATSVDRCTNGLRHPEAEQPFVGPGQVVKSD